MIVPGVPPAAITTERASWRSRKVRYYGGGWDVVEQVLPDFDLRPFTAVPEVGPHAAPFAPDLGELANPFLQVVTRRPRNASDPPMPVGVVSRAYSLVGHPRIAKLCREGIVDGLDVAPEELRYEVGLSELGEWMNFRIYLPRRFDFVDARGSLGLRLECFNSVDGSARLAILFGWLRFVCSNGLVIGETRIRIHERHVRGLDLGDVRSRLGAAFESVGADRESMEGWKKTRVTTQSMEEWCRDTVTQVWGKKAAVRVLHICMIGCDVEVIHPYEAPRRVLGRVRGSPERAETRYDVAQALSFVATDRTNADERVAWQEDIPRLVEELSAA